FGYHTSNPLTSSPSLFARELKSHANSSLVDTLSVLLAHAIAPATGVRRPRTWPCRHSHEWSGRSHRPLRRRPDRPPPPPRPAACRVSPQEPWKELSHAACR